jgi:valyl-tRNA synthetase
MVMMGLKFREEAPFKDVYIHAIVRDEEGQKMSKSKGNVIDPLLLIDKYGADAFRFTLAAFAAQGRDVKFSEDRVEGYRHFINKLWNATRFILMNLEEGYEAPPARALGESLCRATGEGRLSLSSRWIMSRLAAAVEEVNRALDEYRFNDAASAIYQFTWHEFCDWHIEMAKAELQDPSLKETTRQTLLYTLDAVLRLLHPFMPFLTEEIWQSLPMAREKGSISVAAFPEAHPRDEGAEAEAAFVIEAVTGIRNIRGELNIPPAKELSASIKASTEVALQALKRNLHYVTRLARAKVDALGTDVAKPAAAYTAVRDQMEVYVVIESLDMGAEIKRLGKEREKLEESIGFLNAKLNNPDFTDRAPEHIIEKERKRLSELVEKHGKVMESMHRLGGA